MSQISRQLSEPAKKVTCWSRQISLQSQATLSEFDEYDYERTTTGGQGTPKSSTAASSSDSQTSEVHSLGSFVPGVILAGMESSPVSADENYRINVPGAEATAALTQRETGQARATSHVPANTVTVRNVPVQYTKQQLAHELFDAGFKHGRDYDLLYMP